MPRICALISIWRPGRSSSSTGRWGMDETERVHKNSRRGKQSHGARHIAGHVIVGVGSAYATGHACGPGSGVPIGYRSLRKGIQSAGQEDGENPTVRDMTVRVTACCVAESAGLSPIQKSVCLTKRRSARPTRHHGLKARRSESGAAARTAPRPWRAVSSTVCR